MEVLSSSDPPISPPPCLSSPRPDQPGERSHLLPSFNNGVFVRDAIRTNLRQGMLYSPANWTTMLRHQSTCNPRQSDIVGNPCPRLPSSSGMVISHHPKEADPLYYCRRREVKDSCSPAQCTSEDVSMTEAVKMGMTLSFSLLYYNTSRG